MIINADTLEWVKSRPSQSVDHIITDYEYGTEFPFDEFVRICNPNGTILTFCSEHDDPMNGRFTKKAYWIKTPSTKNTTKEISSFVEEIHIFRDKDRGMYNPNLHWSNYVGVYTDMVEEKGWLWKKPLSLMERFIKIYTKPGDLVLDPYMGSGTTLKACKNLDRKYIGIDIDPKWIINAKELNL